MKTSTEKLICFLCIVLAGMLALVLTADVHAYNSTSRAWGCDRMEVAEFAGNHVFAAIPIVGGILNSLRNDCGPLGWIYWIFIAPWAVWGILLALGQWGDKVPWPKWTGWAIYWLCVVWLAVDLGEGLGTVVILVALILQMDYLLQTGGLQGETRRDSAKKKA